MPLFFANTERVLGKVRAMLQQPHEPVLRAIMLSLEETPDVDGSAIEALRVFAAECAARGLQLMLVRLKPRALTVLQRATDDTLRPEMLRSSSGWRRWRRFSL